MGWERRREHKEEGGRRKGQRRGEAGVSPDEADQSGTEGERGSYLEESILLSV